MQFQKARDVYEQGNQELIGRMNRMHLGNKIKSGLPVNYRQTILYITERDIITVTPDNVLNI